MSEVASNPAENPEAIRAALLTVMGVDGGSGPAEDSQPAAVNPMASAAVTVNGEAVPSTEQPAGEVAQPEESPELIAMRQELEATRRKASESIDWGRKGYLRKSNELEQAKGLLKRAMSEGGLSKEEAEAFLAGQVAENRDASTGQFVAQQPDERQMMDASQFVFDYGLSEKQVNEFTAWLASEKSTVTQRDIVANDHYSTLRHSYEKYRGSLEPSPLIAKAAATVARTQREVAKAAGNSPGVSLPTPVAPKEDPSKLKPGEQRDRGYVDAWMNKILEPYRP